MKTKPYGSKYKPEDWPHGLRCIDCDKVFADGDRYASRFEGLTGDGVPITLIVCLECALGAAA